MNKQILTRELYLSVPEHLRVLFDSSEYPWQMLPKIKEYARSIIKEGIKGYTLLYDGVLIGEGAKIAPTAKIEPPAVIGAGSEVRHGAFIRGGVIVGDGCVIGNSSELKNCILLDCVQVPHYNYVGDSVLGYHAHMGAGAICSNLKADKSAVVIHGDMDHETGLRKVGGFLGEYAEVGCGAVLNPGTVIGRNTSVYPLTSLRGVYPPDAVVKGTNEIVKKEK